MFAISASSHMRSCPSNTMEGVRTGQVLLPSIRLYLQGCSSSLSPSSFSPSLFSLSCRHGVHNGFNPLRLPCHCSPDLYNGNGSVQPKWGLIQYQNKISMIIFLKVSSKRYCPGVLFLISDKLNSSLYFNNKKNVVLCTESIQASWWNNWISVLKKEPRNKGKHILGLKYLMQFTCLFNL